MEHSTVLTLILSFPFFVWPCSSYSSQFSYLFRQWLWSSSTSTSTSIVTSSLPYSSIMLGNPLVIFSVTLVMMIWNWMTDIFIPLKPFHQTGPCTGPLYSLSAYQQIIVIIPFVMYINTIAKDQEPDCSWNIPSWLDLTSGRTRSIR